MALEFLSDAATKDSELLIKLDLDGLETLLQIVGAAIGEARARVQANPTLEPRDEGGTAASEPANAFRKVTVTYVVPTRDAATDTN